MLPTEDKTVTDILHQGISGKLKYRPSLGSSGNYQHAYATVSQDSEPIKEGEWFIWKNELFQATTNTNSDSVWANFNGFSSILQSKCRKIIATTDPNIFRKKVYRISKKGETLHQDSRGTYEWINVIPQLQQSFLKEFTTNPDGEYVLEYYFKGERCALCGFYRESNECINRKDCPELYTGGEFTPKLNQDNKVNITSVEEKMMPLRDVEMMCRAAWQVGYNVGYNDELSPSHLTADDWIKENL